MIIGMLYYIYLFYDSWHTLHRCVSEWYNYHNIDQILGPSEAVYHAAIIILYPMDDGMPKYINICGFY